MDGGDKKCIVNFTKLLGANDEIIGKIDFIDPLKANTDEVKLTVNNWIKQLEDSGKIYVLLYRMPDLRIQAVKGKRRPDNKKSLPKRGTCHNPKQRGFLKFYAVELCPNTINDFVILQIMDICILFSKIYEEVIQNY